LYQAKNYFVPDNWSVQKNTINQYNAVNQLHVTSDSATYNEGPDLDAMNFTR